jgi:hypothetical protein
VADHISIDALSRDEIRARSGVAKCANETRHVGPMPHPGTARVNAAPPKIVKVPSLVNECQERDVEVVFTEQRDQESPLPLSATPDVEPRGDEQDPWPVQ